MELGKIGRLGKSFFTSENFEQDGSGADTIEAVDWGKADIATSVDGVVNVLLVGQDTRKAEERARSDSMILLSVNKNTNQLTMISLMRDLYVQIPGYSDNKLNAAYAFGGFERWMKPSPPISASQWTITWRSTSRALRTL